MQSRKVFKIQKVNGEKLIVNADAFDMNVNGYAIFVHSKEVPGGVQGNIVLALHSSQWTEISEIEKDTLRPLYESTGTIIH